MNRRFVHIVFVVITVLFIVTTGGWYLNQSGRVPILLECLTLQKNTNTVSQEPTAPVFSQSAQQQAQRLAVVSVTNSLPRIISCNPRTYGQVWTGRPWCVDDMAEIDFEREDRAISIMDKLGIGIDIEEDGSLSIVERSSPDYRWEYSSYRELLVSDKRYVLMQVKMGRATGYIVVDLISEKITDFFHEILEIERTSKRLVLLDRIIPGPVTRVRWYAFGTEKSQIVAGSEVYPPQSYISIRGPMAEYSVEVIASDDASITLGIYDDNKSSHTAGSAIHEQIGTRVVKF